jgi:hypothetical protein
MVEAVVSEFRAALRRAAKGLADLPRAVRAEILLELAADLEAAYEGGLRRGLGEAEARRAAEERIVGSDAVIRHLGRLHAGSWKGWSAATGARLSGGVGVTLVAAAVIPMLVLAAGAAVPLLVDSPGSPLVWAVVAAGGGVAVLVAREAARLMGGRLPSAGGPPLLLCLAVVAPAVGFLAFLLGLHATTDAFASGAGVDGALLAERIGRDAALFAAGLLIGISGALSWFLIVSRASVLAAREADALIDEGGPPAGLRRRRAGIIPLARRRKA